MYWTNCTLYSTILSISDFRSQRLSTCIFQFFTSIELEVLYKQQQVEDSRSSSIYHSNSRRSTQDIRWAYWISTSPVIITIGQKLVYRFPYCMSVANPGMGKLWPMWIIAGVNTLIPESLDNDENYPFKAKASRIWEVILQKRLAERLAREFFDIFNPNTAKHIEGYSIVFGF